MPSSIKITSKGTIIWTLAAFYFLYEFFARASIAPMSLLLEQALQIDHAGLALISSAYYFAYAVMQVPIGMMVDHWGVKRILIGGSLLCSLGCLVFAHSFTVWHALAGRLLMGLGSSVAFVSLLTVAIHWFPKRLYGFMAGMTQILGVLGPLMAGAPLAWLLVRTHDNWRLIMQDTAIVGVVLTVIILLLVKDHPKHIKTDVPFNPKSLWADCMTLFKNKDARWTALYAFAIYPPVPLLGALWGTAYLENLGYTLTEAAGMNSYVWLGLGLCSPVIGALSDYFNARRTTLMLCAMLGVVAGSILVFAPLGTIGLEVVFFLIGGAAGGQALSFVYLSEHVKSDIEATAIGFNNTAVMIGGATIQLIAGAIMSAISYQAGISLMLVYFSLAVLVAKFKLKD